LAAAKFKSALDFMPDDESRETVYGKFCAKMLEECVELMKD
jgi:hypothetical protein